MKKLTKLTALALALALILGMTAFAGTPSEVLVYDDFSDAADLSLDTFAASRTKLEATPSTAFTATSGVNKYYYHSNDVSLVNVNGKIALQDKAAATRTTRPGLAYTLPEAFTFDKYGKDASYALVAQIDYSPVALKSKGGTADWGFAGIFYDGLKADGTTAITNKSYGAIGAFANNPSFNNTTEYVKYISNNLKSATTSAGYGTTTFGDETVLRMLVRPNWRSSQTNDEDNIVANTKDTFHLIRYVDRKVSKTGYIDAWEDGSPYVQAINGVFYKSLDDIKNRFANFMMYKLSLNREDFKFDTMTTTGIEADKAFEIVFNQPISANTGVHSYAGNRVDIATIITVAKGEETLTYGEDYTIEVSEKIVGNTVKGILSIIPTEDWDFATDYTVTIPAAQGAIMSAARISMLPKNITPVTFTTQKAPTFDVTLKAYKGLSDAPAAEVSALSAGTTYFAVTAKYKEGKPVTNGTVRLEIKDANGNTVKYVTAKKALDEGTTATFGAAFKLEAGMTAEVSIDGGILGGATIGAAQ